MKRGEYVAKGECVTKPWKKVPDKFKDAYRAIQQAIIIAVDGAGKGLRRMRVRYDRLSVIQDAWTTLAACVICFLLLHEEEPLAA
jgi:hypothetical protein